VSDPCPAPIANPDLIGHKGAQALFLKAWQSGRLAHAWLITGPRGIGKATLAHRIARFVLAGGGEAAGGLFGPAPSPTDMALAPDHPVFRRVVAGGHADLRVIERGWSDDKKTRLRTEIVIDDVRGIGAFMALTPAEGGWRVVVIDAADDMNRNAANAVLKVLEEPPANALMLLVSHSPGRLLPTIRSRCRTLALHPLTEPEVRGLVGRWRPDLTDGDAETLARLGEGSAGRALALAEEGGLDLYRDVMALFDSLPRLDILAAHALADRVARPDADGAWRTVTDLTGWWLARLVRAGARPGIALAETVAGEARLMERLLATASLERWLELWEKVTALFARTDAIALDRKQALLTAFLAVERLART
jgi:DNA polymerase III subunit delta'